jgi:GTP-binding protein HflX
MTKTPCFILHPFLKRDIEENHFLLEEAENLAEGIHLTVIEARIIPLNKQHPGYLFGKGTLDTIKQDIAEKKITVVIVNGPLTAIQQRNLERLWKCKVIDRTGLILEIFGERARTEEGQLQVELAALLYQRSRLVRSWTHLERQRGGFGFLGGPGESQLEMDRRLIDNRIQKIRNDLEKVVRTRQLHRKARERVPYPIVALVGYTNAGKSTLFNKLTGEKVLAEDKLFATLDPTMRRLKLPSGRFVILADTVGFISALPTSLIAAFKATLEEVIEADIILHVRDSAHPRTDQQKNDVLKVIEELGINYEEEGHWIEVYNKKDLWKEPPAGFTLEKEKKRAVALSAEYDIDFSELLQTIDTVLSQHHLFVKTKIPLEAGDLLAWLYRNGQIIARKDDQKFAHILVKLSASDAERFQHKKSALHFEA